MESEDYEEDNKNNEDTNNNNIIIDNSNNYTWDGNYFAKNVIRNT